MICNRIKKGTNLYEKANRVVLGLQKEDYEIEEKERSVNITESGIDKVESFFNISNLYAPENILLLHHASQALRAHTLF